jgi:hypothetical protein
MLQVPIPNVLFVFQIYAASVFIWMLHMFHTYVASSLLDILYVCNDFKRFSSVFFKFFQVFSEACFKCFIYLRTNITNVASGCLKS